MERFIHYLRHSFYIPHAALLKPAGLEVDAPGANEAVQRWLLTTANCREHRELQARPVDRWEAEQRMLQPLQLPWGQPKSSVPISNQYHTQVRLDRQPLHHDLSIYDAYLEQTL